MPPTCLHSGFTDSLIQDVIYSHLVLPNRITIPLVSDVELAKLRFPMPKVLMLCEKQSHNIGFNVP